MLIQSLRAEWWSWLGRRDAKNGDYQSALACFQRVLLSFPDSAYAYSNIGYCHSGLRHYEEAVKAYDRALQAIEELNRAFRIDPKLKSKADYQLVLASALARLGHTDQALETYKDATRLDSCSAEAHFAGVGIVQVGKTSGS